MLQIVAHFLRLSAIIFVYLWSEFDKSQRGHPKRWLYGRQKENNAIQS